MIQIEEYQNQSVGSKYYGKYYARTVDNPPIGLTELAQHMAEHNTPYSPGCIKGVLTDMVTCIRHLLLDGTNVVDIHLTAQSTGKFTREELTKAKKNITYGTKTRAAREAARPQPEP